MSSQVEKMLVDRAGERETESNEMLEEADTMVGEVMEDVTSLEDAVEKRSAGVSDDMIEHLGGSSLKADEMRGFLSGGELVLSETGEDWTENVKTQSTPAPRAPFSMEHATISSDEDILSTYRAEFALPGTPMMEDSSMCDSVDAPAEKSLSASCPDPSSSPSMEASGTLTRSTNSSLTQIRSFFSFVYFLFFFLFFLSFFLSFFLFSLSNFLLCS